MPAASDSIAPPAPRPLAARLALASLRWMGALLGALLLLEVTARIMGFGIPPRGPNNRLPIRTSVAAEKAPFLHETLKPSTFGEVLYPGYGDVADRVVHYRINRDGFRDRADSYAVPKPEGVFRIAVLGDSVTYGTGVEFEATFPKVMERGLAEAGLDCMVEVMNCGVFAHNTSQQLAWFEFNVRRFEPDLVLVVSTIPDASGRNLIKPADTVEVVSSEARWIERLGLTSGVWDAGDGEGLTPAKQRTMALRRNSVLVDLVAHRLYGWLRGQLMYESYKGDWAPGSPGHTMVGKSLERLAVLAREDGFQLLVAMHPTLVQLDGNYPFASEVAVLRELCDQRRIPFRDLLVPLMGLDGSALQVHPHDRHPNAEAHAIVGAYLVAELAATICSR